MDFFFFFLRVLISRFVTFDECFFNCIKFDSSGGGGVTSSVQSSCLCCASCACVFSCPHVVFVLFSSACLFVYEK